MNFEIDVKQVKIASSQEKISQTIEGLLALNDKIPAHTDNEIMDTTEKQLESGKYDNKSSRGEEDGITEFQMDDDNRHGDPVDTVQEEQFEAAKNTDGGHRPEMWDKDDQKSRGHRNVPPIWLQIHKQENDRRNKPIEKKLD